MSIVLVPYTSTWLDLFNTEVTCLQELIAEFKLQVEHIGSTSVEGLIAKPIIDILIGLPDFEGQVSEFVQIMCEKGYVYIPRYENIMPNRRYFWIERSGQRYNLHAVAIGSDFWMRHLLFRNYLRLHPNYRDAYALLKIALATLDWSAVGDYAEAKTPFIRQVERQAVSFFGYDRELER